MSDELLLLHLGINFDEHLFEQGIVRFSGHQRRQKASVCTFDTQCQHFRTLDPREGGGERDAVCLQLLPAAGGHKRLLPLRKQLGG